MKLVNKTGARVIDEAILIFYDRVPRVLADLGAVLPPHGKDFSYTDDQNLSVLNTLTYHFRSGAELLIMPWNPWRWWTAAIGYYSGGNEIYVNMRKIESLTSTERAGNFAHEFSHFCGYQHGNNYPSALKDMSVPYAFGYLVGGEKMYPLNKYPSIHTERAALFV